MNASLFILFKEYADQTQTPSSLYINAESWINSEKFIEYFNQWMFILEFFHYEVCDRYYDGENIKHALYPYSLLCNEYAEQTKEYPNVGLYVKAQFVRWGINDWREVCINESKQQYSYNDHDVTDDSLGEICRQNELSKNVVLLNCNAIDCANPIVVKTSLNSLIKIDYVDDIQSLYKWFCLNRKPQRKFIYNPKHGDINRLAQMIAGTERQAAQLETTCENAQRLLELAIGDDKNGALWFYDAEKQKFIYFENQREIRLAFHGYHLQEGEENFDNINRNKINLIINTES